VAWDLDPLVEGRGEEGARAQLAEAAERAGRFAERHRGRVEEIATPGELAAAMRELVEIAELVSRAGYFAMLRFATDTADSARGALLAHVQEREAQIETALLFFELEWAALDEERAQELTAAEELDFCRHHLRTRRRYRPHLLSEPEERVMTERAVTGRTAWARLFAEQASAVTVEVGDSDPVALDVALSRLASPDREERRAVAQAVTVALEPGLRTRGFILNTLLADKAVEDRLRSYPHWLASRNLANEASDESVAALVEAVRGRYELPRRWYRLKAQLLGVDKLADYDRAATVAGEDPDVAWAEAQDLVLESMRAFSPDLGKVATRFFDESWIDAPVRPGKRPGAFCAYTVPSVHPYLLLNWTGKRRDVLILAHELGHGLHAALAAPQGLLHQGTPLTMAETASVFGETIVFGRLLEATPDPRSRLSLLAESIEGSIATVFRQIAMNRFEQLAHDARRGEGELALERLGDLWIESQQELFGDAVEVTEGYRTWWSYIPHFIDTPGYVYAYAYGQLLALSVYGRYLEEGEPFVPRYLELLSAGGSRSPEELGAIVGVDLADPGFWDSGLDLVEGQLGAAEAAAAEVRAA
jgi:oligoendopeptidase F